MLFREERTGSRLMVVAILASLALVVLVASPVIAASRPTLAVRPSAIPAGARLAVVGAGFIPNRAVDLYVGQPRSEVDLIQTLRAGAHGGFRMRVRVGSWVTPGRYILMACQRACRLKVRANFRVIGAVGASDRTGVAGARAYRR